MEAVTTHKLHPKAGDSFLSTDPKKKKKSSINDGCHISGEQSTPVSVWPESFSSI